MMTLPSGLMSRKLRFPVIVNTNAALIGEEDWQAIFKTLYFLSVPGLREWFRKGLSWPVAACARELRWYVGSSSSRRKPGKLGKSGGFRSQ